MDLATVKLDAAKVTGGVWWALERLADGTLTGKALRGLPGDEPALLIRPVGVEYARAREAAERPFRVEMRDKKLTPEDERRIFAESIAEALWLDAHNITMQGKPWKFDKAEAAKMLADVAWENVRYFIWSAANERAALLASEESKAAGN